MMIKRNYHLLFWIVTVAILLFGARQMFSSSAPQAPSALSINEILASNVAGLTDEDGDHSDWIEIYNRSNQTVNLSGWALTDDLTQPSKWTFPNLTLGSHEYLVVFASGKNRSSTEDGSLLHTNFQLNKAGEPLGLYNILDDRLEDVVLPQFPEQFQDISYGRYGETQNSPEQKLAVGYLANPTPGDPNDESLAWVGAVAEVEFSHERDFYDTPFLLELTSTTPGATILYTIDGSEPTERNGAVYSKPISIKTTTAIRAIAVKPKFLPSAVATHSYIFLNNVMVQPSNPPGFPETWGIHSKDIAGYTKGSSVQADYEMDPEVVNNPRYGDIIKDGLKSIPTMSIVTELQNLEIYGVPRLRGETYERPVSVELLYANKDRKEFQINAGLRIQGGEARWEYIPKHSFRLYFKRKYGPTKLEYPLFPDSPVEEFDTIILRGGTSESYAGRPRSNPRWSTYTRDEWLRASQIAVSGIGSHGIFVHLYLNGLYWGLYNVLERPDASFTSSYLGGSKEDWFAAKHGFAAENSGDKQEMWYAVNHGEPISGSSARYEALHKLASTGDLADPAAYEEIRSFLDVPQFIDYFILNWYAGRDGDWTQNNWYAGVQNPAGQVMYFNWDGENIWADGARINLGDPEPRNVLKLLFEALAKNPDFKIELADRLYKHLSNDGALTDANSQARWKRINDVIDRAVVGESARWGDTRYDTPVTRDDWLQARDGVLNQMDGNADKLIALAREAGYYPNLDPPVLNQNGGLVTPGFKLTMSTPLEKGGADGGIIHYTTDGSDPRLPVSGAVNPKALTYDAPLVLTRTTQVKARLLANDPSATSGDWSALNEAVFKVVEQDSQLRLTEIMYNPMGSDDYEFIELQNAGGEILNLSNFYFEGVRFTFSPNTRPLGPGEFFVLVSNPAAFAERYPDVPVGGIYDGQLSNKGEEIVVKDHQGNTVLQAAYDDENNWPVSPDGSGDSLVLINLEGDPNDPKSWQASANLNGSPGTDDPARR